MFDILTILFISFSFAFLFGFCVNNKNERSCSCKKNDRKTSIRSIKFLTLRILKRKQVEVKVEKMLEDVYNNRIFRNVEIATNCGKN